MKKGILKFNMLAILGVLGLGMMTSPIAAEEGKETRANEKFGETQVIYTSTNTEVEPLTVMYMTIPSDINLTKKEPIRNSNIKLSTKNGKSFSEYNNPKKFKAIIDVFSKNNGKLKSKNSISSLEANYTLRNTKFGPVIWDSGHKGLGFITFSEARYGLNSNTLSQEVEFKVEQDQFLKLESAENGTRYNDILTFRIGSIEGNGLKPFVDTSPIN